MAGKELRETLEQLDGRDLRLVVELGRTKSVSSAAKRCGIGQPAATKRLQRIATTFGLQLIEPTSSGLELTAAGKALSAHGQRVGQSAMRFQRILETDDQS